MDVVPNTGTETWSSQTPYPPQFPVSTHSLSVLPYACAIFLSAFLLFQVEPIIARYILPWFGGTPAVWTTCMLFFQVFLLGGYAYAHLLARLLSPRHQAAVHLTLVVCSLTFLPITPGEEWKPEGPEHPMPSIILLLLATIGMPFLLVSATAPLLQHWFSRVHPTTSPYRLYALSNFGSLLGLISYPFLVEPQLGVARQTLAWSFGYGLYALACAWGAVLLVRAGGSGRVSGAPVTHSGIAPRLPDNMLTLVLAACGSVILLAGTNQICRDFAVIPFLWVLPLSLYLISFILCFDHPRWYDRRVWTPLFLLSVSGVVYLLHQEYGGTEVGFYSQILLYSSALFACCMVCHGELVRLKPPPDQLTSFYLLVALGGAGGGVFVNLIAPVLFEGYWEFHLGLLATMGLLGLCLHRQYGTCPSPRVVWSGRILWVAGLTALAMALGLHIQKQQESNILTTRNFYGVLRVKQTDPETEQASRFLYHGRISHGRQFLDPARRSYPTSYYGPFSGISLAISRHPQRLRAMKGEDGTREKGLHVGIIGLGVGTIATYSKPGDTFRFYEINPEVERLAREYFTYLDDAEGHQEVVLGDGRIALERELATDRSQQFDILAVDAFSGDGIPVHLLTREAFALYWEHLQPDGVLAFHITNGHFDLSPVIRALARDADKRAMWIKDMTDRERGNNYNSWILVTSNPAFLRDPFVNFRIAPWPTLEETLWTDDYSNLFDVVTR